ncbi:hypothetical protein [uncultured Aquimarina sp.]|uniref:hypothetical protein n=1 Tax=uncultured Aquimarina sp. TaxID=575652 RepID=UPI002619B5B9|nr:hypothetical protein [uncultured Aquimarina sp.]
MKIVSKKCFPKARFHVQKLALEALQDSRIKHQWEEAINQKNEQIKLTKTKQIECRPETFDNGDTRKTLSYK